MSFASRRRRFDRGSAGIRVVSSADFFCRPNRPRSTWPGGVVSFTFDDFPRSAWSNGGAVLEEYDVRGTYYAAMGLAGTARIISA